MVRLLELYRVGTGTVLKKFVKIHNVGRFEKAGAYGDQDLRPLTLIHAANGRGKTTLCDVLRSVKTGDPAYLIGRQTLAQTDGPAVDLLFDTGNAIFKNGAWTATHDEIEIFDTAFVRDNIYAGDVVEHGHKRNLFRVIVGQKGVALASIVDGIDVSMRDSDREINDARVKVTTLAPAGMNADDFVAIQADPEVESKIRDAESELTAVSRVDDIQRAATLKAMVLPEFPTEFTSVLAKRLDDVSEEAERRIREHLSSHTAGTSERWLEEGINNVLGDECPFCGQGLSGVDLISAYRSYFSDAYRGLKSQAHAMETQIASMGSEVARLQFDRDISTNAELGHFWEQFTGIVPPKMDLAMIQSARDELVAVALELAKAKTASPLESISPNDKLTQALDSYALAKRTVHNYNQLVSALNIAADTQKKSVAVSDRAKLETGLRQLRTIQIRQSTESIAVCDHFSNKLSDKKKLEEEKKTAKDALDTHNSEVLGQCQDKINTLLKQFGASFTIDAVKSQYVGGRTSVTYVIVINDAVVELGDASSPIGQPSFRNTLSAGDRSSLALAFFLAQLEMDPRLKSKVVVFDDPFGSQDRTRRTCTRQQICGLVDKVEQVIVLSHERGFLREVWLEMPQAKSKTLKLLRIGVDSTVIREWDIKEETDPEYIRDIRVLKNFVDKNDGDSRHVAKTIRPVLEGYLRINSPGHFQAHEWLGDFINKIRIAAPGDPLVQWQSILPELESINGFSKRYHHNTNDDWQGEPIDDTELATFVGRTLDLVPAA